MNIDKIKEAGAHVRVAEANMRGLLAEASAVEGLVMLEIVKKANVLIQDITALCAALIIAKEERKQNEL